MVQETAKANFTVEISNVADAPEFKPDVVMANMAYLSEADFDPTSDH